MQEEPKEEKKEIKILDKGIETKAIIGPQWSCCWGQYMAFRW
ncbi:hypothetical protein ACFL9U_10090 [Thermodesulfobacteriota bacterium]